MNPTNYVVTTTLFGVKQYVTGYFNRFDHRVCVELTKKREEAKDFLSRDAATTFLPVIYNPFERTYKVEALPPCNPSNKPASRTASWLEERVLK